MPLWCRMRSFEYYTASGLKLPLRSYTQTLSFSRKSVPFTDLSRFSTFSVFLAIHRRFFYRSTRAFPAHPFRRWWSVAPDFDEWHVRFSSRPLVSPIILLDASDRPFYRFLSFFFGLSFTASPCLVSVATLLSPLPLSRSLSASSLRFMFTPTQRATRRLKMLIHRTRNGDAIYTIGLLYDCLQVDKMSLITAAWQMPFTMWPAKSSIAGDHGPFADVALASTSQFARITKSR